MFNFLFTLALTLFIFGVSFSLALAGYHQCKECLARAEGNGELAATERQEVERIVKKVMMYILFLLTLYVLLMVLNKDLFTGNIGLEQAQIPSRSGYVPLEPSFSSK